MLSASLPKILSMLPCVRMSGFTIFLCTCMIKIVSKKLVKSGYAATHQSLAHFWYKCYCNLLISRYSATGLNTKRNLIKIKKLFKFRLCYKDWHEIRIILLVIVYFLSCLFIFLFFFIDLVPLVKKENEED